MKIDERRVGQHVLLDVTERLTIKDDLDRLEKAVDGLIGQGEQKLAIGLSQITYMDSTGSAILIVCYNKACEAGRHLCFVSPSRHVAKIFEITKLDTIFEIVDEAALLSGCH